MAYDGLMDKECIDVCDWLNKYKGVVTYESCCGHLKNRFSVFFHCYDWVSLAKLYRCVNRNYSTGLWEIVVDGSDTTPCFSFWLRSIDVFKSDEEMDDALKNLIENLKFYLNCPYENYFLDDYQKQLRLHAMLSIKDKNKKPITGEIAKKIIEHKNKRED